MKNIILAIAIPGLMIISVESCRLDVRSDYEESAFIESIHYGKELCQEFYRNRATMDQNVKSIREFAKSFLAFNKLTKSNFQVGIKCPTSNILVIVKSEHDGKTFAPGIDPKAEKALGSYDSISYYYKGWKYKSKGQVKQRVLNNKEEFGYSHTFY